MASQKASWNHEADKDLLLAIIFEGSLKSISWPNIAARMETKNYTFTHEACRQHYQKLRRGAGGGAAKDDSASPAKTPRKSKAATTPKSGRKIAINNTFGNGHQDDDEDFDIPAIKRKRTVKAESIVKAEQMVKAENADVGSGFKCQNASLFKIESLNNPVIDLDDEGLYDDEA